MHVYLQNAYLIDKGWLENKPCAVAVVWVKFEGLVFS